VLHRPRPAARLAAIALANAGGVVGYLPLLTLLLPIRIDEVAPAGRIAVLTAATIAGAIAASLSNIAFGWWSDRALHRGVGRRRFMGWGLGATMLAYFALALADTAAAIVAAVVAFQIAINAVLGPFLAAVADEVPDDRKGAVGGLIAFANPFASAVSVTVVGATFLGDAGRFAAVAAVMAACVLPYLIVPPRRDVPSRGPANRAATLARGDMIAAWIGRMLVQFAGSVLFYYLLYYFHSIAAAASTRTIAVQVGQLMLLSSILPVPIAIVGGRLSDRWGRRKPMLVAGAAVGAAGLVLMSAAAGWTVAAAGFALYSIGSATFLALHATVAMQLLPSARNRGRDLGLVNLTNTLPSLIGPLLTWALASPDDFAPLLLTLAGLTACGGLAMLGVRRLR